MIEHIEIEGFKSIKKMALELRPINILIGGNGSGKSNFISFFKLLNAIFNRRLQKYVIEEKADNLLYYGRKRTRRLKGKIVFTNGEGANNAYYFILAQTNEGGLYIEKEASGFNVTIQDNNQNYFDNYDIDESEFAINPYKRNEHLRKYISSLQVFHFHDTSQTSYLRRECDLNDNLYLKPDGRNLPAFLYLLKAKHPVIYNRIEKVIQSVAPYVDRFILEPNRLNEKEIELRWVDKGDPESSFSAYQLSDGTLRFIALATLLLQPEPPTVIIIDEPELGLHPFAINKLAGMIQSAAAKGSQVIAATQSSDLLSHFQPEDVITVDQKDGATIFTRLDTESLKIWLEDYSIEDLWKRNIIEGGQP